MKIIFIFALIVAPSSVFSQALPSTPNYGNAQPVPRAFAQALINRGLSASQIIGTMNGVAAVAVNDNAAIVASSSRTAMGMRVGSWLAIAGRSASWVGVGLTAAQIGLYGYEYFYGKDTSRNTAAQGNASSTAGLTNVSGSSPPAQSDGEYTLREWQSTYFKCDAGSGTQCALGDAKLRMVSQIDFLVKSNPSIQYVIKSYSAECPSNNTSTTQRCYVNTQLQVIYKGGSSSPDEIKTDGSANAYFSRKNSSYTSPSLPCAATGDQPFYCGGSAGTVELPSYIPYPVVEIPFYLPSERSKELIRPEIPARILDDLWKRASQRQDYQGAAYPLNDPMTASELATSRLTVGDLSAPVVDPAAASLAWAPSVNPWPQGNPNYPAGQAPAWTPPSSTETNPSGDTAGSGSSSPSTKEPDPGVAKPSDPDVPTIDKILSPIWKFGENRKTFNTPTTSRECPLVSFTLWEKKIESRVHCDMIESVRPQIEALFIFAWILGTYLIVLSA